LIVIENSGCFKITGFVKEPKKKHQELVSYNIRFRLLCIFAWQFLFLLSLLRIDFIPNLLAFPALGVL